jgi:hypothetical protein
MFPPLAFNMMLHAIVDKRSIVISAMRRRQRKTPVSFAQCLDFNHVFFHVPNTSHFTDRRFMHPVHGWCQ